MLWSLLFICLSLSDGKQNPCEQEISNKSVITSQSSNYLNGNDSFNSQRAVDGNKEICAHTIKQNNSWWTIDLRGVYNICCISIYNKDQGNIEINYSQIRVGNSRENNGTTHKLCKNITNFQLAKWNNYECDTAMSGRYVTVVLPREELLILCEVKINGTKRDSPFVLVKENKTWEDALYYCRDKHRDLASILDQETQAWAELEAKEAQTDLVWLGLHYTCILEFWFWVEDHRLDFSRLADETTECDRSAAMERNEDHRWFSMSDYDKFNFICLK